MPEQLGPMISRLDLRTIHERRQLAALRRKLMTRLRETLETASPKPAEPVPLRPEELLELAKRQIRSELQSGAPAERADAAIDDSYPDNAFLPALAEAANAGDAEAQYLYGMCRLRGIRVAQMNTSAVALLRKAAMQGCAPAQYQLGLCYSDGTGLAKNETSASEWLLKAAKNGHAGAQLLMAERYQHGVGVKKSFFEARKWTAQAAKTKSEENGS